MRGLSKNYHLILDPKLGQGACEIQQIPCACVACTLMLDKTRCPGVLNNEQPHYNPILDFK